MKKYNRIIIISICVYFSLAFLSGNAILSMEEQRNHGYRVESNRIINQLNSIEDIDRIKIEGYQYIQSIDYLKVEIVNQSLVQEFFAEDNQF